MKKAQKNTLVQQPGPSPGIYWIMWIILCLKPVVGRHYNLNQLHLVWVLEFCIQGENTAHPLYISF